MPRVARSILPDYPLHVVQRGINRADCFFQDSDYLAYLRDLRAFSERFGCSLHAYCLMTNHVHLLLTPHAQDACAWLMKQLGQCHVQRINRRLERTGTLWEGRFRSCLVASDNYVLACYRYIELNPVRAGMVTHPEQYRWSSYSANAADLDDRHLSAHPSYQALASGTTERRQAYRVLCEQPPPASHLEEIRKATRIGCTVGKPRRRRGRPFLLDEKNGVCPHLS